MTPLGLKILRTKAERWLHHPGTNPEDLAALKAVLNGEPDDYEVNLANYTVERLLVTSSKNERTD